MVLCRYDYVFHSSIFGQLDNGVGIKGRRVECSRFGHVFFHRDSCLGTVHYPFGIPVVDFVFPNSFQFGVKTKMDEHSIIPIFEHDLLRRPGVLFLGWNR